jgi:acetyl-CoA acetyltransferase
MKTFGLTHETLAMVSVVQREWAAKNPRALQDADHRRRCPQLRMIAYPFRLLQCCLVTDGGGALILVAAGRAKDFPQRPVYLLGTGESVETPTVSQMQDFTSSRAFRVAGPKAFAEAGITHKDVDHLMIYEPLRICRSTASRIWVLSSAARPVPLSPRATPPPAENCL